MGRRTVFLIASLLIAALGTLVVFTFAANADKAAAEGQEPVEVLVATEAIPAGTTAKVVESSGDTELKTLPKASVPANALSNLTSVENLLTVVPVQEGQVLIPEMFSGSDTTTALNLPDGTMAMSVELEDPQRVAGFVTPGSEVAVFATVTLKDVATDKDLGKHTDVIIDRVRVVAVGPSTLRSSNGDAETVNSEEIPTAILTLAVTTEEAKRLAAVYADGDLHFALLDSDSKVVDGPAVSGDNVFRRLITLIAILEPDALSASGLRDASGDAATTVATFEALGVQSGQYVPAGTVVLGPSLDTEAALDFAATIRRADPTCGVLLVRRRVDAALMGAAMVAGVREVVAERDLPALTAAVVRSEKQTAALRRGSEAEVVDDIPVKSGRVVTVWSPKGGSGKTSIATNVAVSLATAGHRVLLVDLDLAFGDVAISLGLRPMHDFSEVAEMGDRIDRSALRGVLTQHESGAWILSPPNEPGITERVSTALVARLLSVARTDFDYIVVDSAPVLDERNIATLEASDAVLVPTILDIPSIKNLRVGIDTLRLISYPTDRLKVVLNRGDVKVGLDPDEVSKSLGLPVVATLPSSLGVTTATNRGVAIVSDDPKNPVSLAIEALIDAVVLKPEHVRPERLRSTRLFSRKRHAA